MFINLKKSLTVALIMMTLSACNNGSDNKSETTTPPPPAKSTGLQYTNPTSTGWRLEQDASSTRTRIVLNLIGPADLASRGVGFNVQADPRVLFGGFENDYGGYANDTGVFKLKNSEPTEYTVPLEPIFFASGLLPNNVLSTGIFQKDRRIAAASVGSAVVQIALEFDASKLASYDAGERLSLSVIKARMIPADIGGTGEDETYVQLMEKAHLDDISIAVGTLITQ